LFLLDHVGYFDASECGRGWFESLKTHSRLGNLFDKTVVLFDNVIEVFHSKYLNPVVGPREFQPNIYPQQARQICPAFIDHYPMRNAICLDRAFKEAPGSSLVASL